MIETILIARENQTGKTVVLAGLEVPYQDQLAQYKEFSDPIHEEFSTVGIFTLTPVKKPLRFITQKVADARAKEHAARVKAAEEAAKQAEAKQADEKPAKKKKK